MNEKTNETEQPQTQSACSGGGCPFAKVLASRWGNVFFLGLIATAVARVYTEGAVADGFFVASILFGLAIIAILFGFQERLQRFRHNRQLTTVTNATKGTE